MSRTAMSAPARARRLPFVVRLAALVAFVFTPTAARADVAACIASSEQALSLRHAGKLQEARRQLASCATSACPDELRVECTKRMDAINEAMPSLVIGAKDAAGNDLTQVDVSLDGAPVATVLDGRPIDLDPGEHTLRLTAPGLPLAERKLVVGEGEKTRHEGFVLGEVAIVPAPPPAPPPLPVPEPTHPDGRSRRTLAIASGALGIAGIGTGAAFGLLASSEWSSSKNATTAQTRCASAAACPAHTTAVSDHDSAVTNAAVSTVAFGVGAALIVTGIVAWVTAPPRAAHPEVARIRLLPAVSRDSGTLTLVGEF